MQQLYFIRHGNADYLKGCLTHRGIQQVERLSSTLETLLPEGLQGILVFSPSDRAVETAKILLPLIERKTGKKIYIEKEELLSELRSMGSEKSILERGRENVALVEKYHASDYGFFVAHEKIIVATCIAIAESHEIPIPNFLKPVEDQPDKETFDLFMKRKKYSREEALMDFKRLGWDPWIELPSIAEASAIHLDIVQKQIEYILPS